ncbi:hypothetical protein H6F74_26560 [Trichocoleus sp. FACHB-90]|uniref:hypothetical protein n=1 Tax=Cyanophyceae TaxID=3028117 RepID=UPI00168665EC|nr:hypothetical protein [Trichocoleus sp. FACHB-90]MBD1929768.1 hypothetical protein [Trichocoleus sp. FACHB-90]
MALPWCMFPKLAIAQIFPKMRSHLPNWSYIKRMPKKLLNLKLNYMKIRNYISLLVRRTLPEVYNTYHGYQKLKLPENIQRINNLIIQKHGLVVQSGPFAGMVHVGRKGGAALVPTLIGCYEEELHEILDSVIKTNYDKIINVGSGEGYYAVGFALKIPTAKIYAFEINPIARRMSKEMARANSVFDRMFFAGECDIKALNEAINKKSLVFMDCEGGELDLLQPELAPNLRYSDVLVELHDFLNPTISETILSRFKDTHDITLVSSTKREPEAYAAIGFLNEEDRQIAVSEFRPAVMQWAFMTAKSYQK